MNNEYFINHFFKIFSHLFDKRISLYGVGYYTKLILDNFSQQMNLIGIIDDIKNGTIMYGLIVLGIDEAVKQSDVIIIVSNLSVSDLIYRRISKITSTYNVDVYFTNGMKPYYYDKNIGDNPWWNNTENDLMNALNEHDIISFDVFDTLVVRKMITPESVLDEVGEYLNQNIGLDIDFASQHHEAEKYCYKINRYFDIEMIFDRITSVNSWDESLKEKVMEKEIQLEIENAIPRPYAINLLKKTKKKFNKYILITSDMYLHTPIIEIILKKCGLLKGIDYDDIYISCDKKASKHIGDIFTLIKNDYNALKIFHIGDNYNSDIISANENEISNYWLLSPQKMYDLCGFNNLIKSINKKSLPAKGIFINKAFDNPYNISSNRGKVAVNNMFDFGYLFIGPVLAYYINWIIDKSQTKKIKTLLFVSRDGFLLKKAFDYYKNKFNVNIESIYFLTSRRASSVACINNVEVIRFVLDNLCIDHSMKYSKVMKDFFGVECSDHDEYFNSYMYEIPFKDALESVLKYYNQIVLNSNEELKCYKKYIGNTINDTDNKIGLVNLVGKGITQYFVEKILGKKLIGLYLATEPEISDICLDDNYFSAFGYNESQHISKKNVVKYFLFLENIFSAPFGCLRRFDENGNPIYGNDIPKNIKHILQCHEGALTYIKELSIIPDKVFADELFGTFNKENILLSDEVKKCFSTNDFYSDKNNVFLL